MNIKRFFDRRYNRSFGMIDVFASAFGEDFIDIEIEIDKEKYPNAWAVWSELQLDENKLRQAHIEILNFKSKNLSEKPVFSFCFYAGIIRIYEDLPFMVSDEGKPRRHYHNASHLEYLATEYQKIKHLIPEEDREAFILALFYHDYVYDGKPAGADERASAEALEKDNKILGFSPKVIERAKEFIYATYDTTMAINDPIIALFVDMDRSILGAPSEDYMRYLDGVKKEFCGFYNLTEKQFLIARLEKFTEPLMNSGEKIFKSDYYSALENQARENLFREVVRAYALKTNPAQLDTL